MSGRLGQRRALRGIEQELTHSDPRLAALFLSVARLSRRKDMPDAEMIRATPRWLPPRLGGRAGRRRAAGEDGRERPRTIR